MDFGKLFKGVTPNMGSNLKIKIGNPPKLNVRKCFCMWSDLLGFSCMFEQTTWILNKEQCRKIYDRLEAAHSAVLYYSSIQERNLILNDGIAKVYHPYPKENWIHNILGISMYIRSCVELHMSISETEHKKGFPGCRSVIAFGDNIEYLVDEIRLDDYVVNYSKPQGSDLSDLAKRTGNPVIIYNPRELQMNTAFSKAYLLESGGTKAGLPGNFMYIDQSALDGITLYAKDKGYTPVLIEDEESIKFFVPRKQDNLSDVILGFCFDKKVIVPSNVRYQTKVYKLLLRYYPWDEKTEDFFFDVNNPK